MRSEVRKRYHAPSFFFFNDTATPEIYTLSLHAALPICLEHHGGQADGTGHQRHGQHLGAPRSEEHTSELQSRLHLVCRLLLEKKKPSQPPQLPAEPSPLHPDAYTSAHSPDSMTIDAATR